MDGMDHVLRYKTSQSREVNLGGMHIISNG
jgi:hypothetical protein